jgi:hypothetical protein
MVGAKQQETRDFILVPAGAVRPTVVCSRHYIALHRSACSGAATSKAGEEARPPSPWWSDRSEFRCRGAAQTDGEAWPGDRALPRRGGRRRADGRAAL